MDVKVGDWVKCLVEEADLEFGKVYQVTGSGIDKSGPYIVIEDDVGDPWRLLPEEYKLCTEPEETQEVSDNTYTLTVSLQGTGSFFTKTKDIVLPTGAKLITLISKLNEL